MKRWWWMSTKIATGRATCAVPPIKKSGRGGQSLVMVVVEGLGLARTLHPAVPEASISLTDDDDEFNGNCFLGHHMSQGCEHC
ncbi:hypothetical protein IWX49DRAFT_577056 [Phyllosticta citricarpa]